MIIINLIYIFNLLLFLYFIQKLFLMLVQKSSDIYQYKIIDKYLSSIIIVLYITLVIIALYLYRIYHIGNMIDLKILKNNYQAFIMLDIPLIFKIYFILHVILLLLILFLLILNVHKISKLEIFKIYIIINYDSFLRKNKYTKNLFNFLQDIALYNIISFFLKKTCYHMELFLKDFEISQGAIYKEFEMPDYKFSTVIHNIVHHRFFTTKLIYTFDMFLYYFIPLFLITYDIIFNCWVLSYIFYYLFIIIPIRLLQHITKTIAQTDPRITKLIWEIYYKKENCIYVYTKEQKMLLDTYLLNGLQMLPGLALVFLSENLYYFATPLCFKLIEKRYNFYQNHEGLLIQEFNNGDFFIVKDYLFDTDDTDEKSFITYGEKVIMFVDKRA